MNDHIETLIANLINKSINNIHEHLMEVKYIIEEDMIQSQSLN